MEKVFKVINEMHLKGILASIDKILLSDILEKHALDKKFDDFMKRYYE